MAVKIRLARRGRKNLARYDVVVSDSRSPRDGKFIEKIGTYDPLTVPATINLNEERAFAWLMNGAQPSDTVKAMLSYRGVMLKRHLQIGVVKGALTQEQADGKHAAWKAEKESRIQLKKDSVSQTKQDVAKARKDAETKIKDARTEAIRKKTEAAKAALEAPAPAPAVEEVTNEVSAPEAAVPEAAAPEAAAPEAAAPEGSEAAPEAQS